MNHGGKRPGAGRPVGTTKQGGMLRQVNVRMSEGTYQKALALGDGNASEGLRMAMAHYPGGRNGMP